LLLYQESKEVLIQEVPRIQRSFDPRVPRRTQKHRNSGTLRNLQEIQEIQDSPTRPQDTSRNVPRRNRQISNPRSPRTSKKSKCLKSSESLRILGYSNLHQ
jgi:hypothetical protein